MVYVLVIFAGICSAIQGPMNNLLRDGMKNAWLAGSVVFVTQLFLFLLIYVFADRKLATGQELSEIPWYAYMGGLMGAVIVYAMLTVTKDLGAGTFNGLLVSAGMITALVLDHYGLLGLAVKPITLWRTGGGALLVAGVLMLANS